MISKIIKTKKEKSKNDPKSIYFSEHLYEISILGPILQMRKQTGEDTKILHSKRQYFPGPLGGDMKSQLTQYLILLFMPSLYLLGRGIGFWWTALKRRNSD